MSDLRAELQAALAGAYAIERELGRGGMGAVYLARDLALDRPVAIKVLPPDLAVRAELRERFLRETRVAASFSHPNIVPVHAVEDRAGLLCFVMGFVDGETLAQRLRRTGPLGAVDAVRLLQEVAWALSYAHSRGVVHRDVKPDNILLERATGRALVTDFGIARTTAAAGLTAVGEVVGTPHFMSPEQAAGDSIDGRSDLYSLGVVGFTAVTGQVPFEGTSSQAILAQHLTQPPPSLALLRPDLPAALIGAIERCLAKAPEARMPTGEALVEMLDAARVSRPEVAPALRVFHVKAGGLMRSAFLLLSLIPAIATRGPSADRVVKTAVFTAIIVGLLLQVGVEMRELARAGFSFDDLRHGLASIGTEQLDTAERRHSAPDWAGRRRRWWIVLTLVGAAGIAAFATAFTVLRTAIPGRPGYYRIGYVGIALAVAGAAAAMLAFVSAIASSSLPVRAERRLINLLGGGAARRAFALASRGLAPARTGGTPPAAADRGSLTVLATLPRASRRRLRESAARLAGLGRARAQLGVRERQLDGALADAVRGARAEGAVAGLRDRLVAELTAARNRVQAERTALLAEDERARLNLLRVRSGLMSVDAFKRELGG